VEPAARWTRRKYVPSEPGVKETAGAPASVPDWSTVVPLVERIA
jgi:hypothetical protein